MHCSYNLYIYNMPFSMFRFHLRVPLNFVLPVPVREIDTPLPGLVFRQSAPLISLIVICCTFTAFLSFFVVSLL
jgi:hypothetical protein